MTFPVRCTGYWPFTARPDEQRMEGGTKDRKGYPLHTLEDFQAGRSDFVSVSGDYTIFPYGQRLEIAEWPGVIFRVVDTGGHFYGPGKVYRLAQIVAAAALALENSASAGMATAGSENFFRAHFERGGMR